MKGYYLFTFLLFSLKFQLYGQEPKLFESKFGMDSIGGQNIQMQYYYINATTTDELKKAIEEERAKDPKIKHFMARTRSRVKWNWVGYGKDTCDLNSLSLSYEINIRFPRWNIPDSLPDEDKKRWTAFIKSLAEHELGHVKVTIEHMPKMEKRIKNAICKTADGHARGSMLELDQAQMRYDDVTFHGWLQGAKF